MVKIAIVSTKGGVGKTTLTANLAGHLSLLGKKVLMVDADPQPSLSSWYQILKQASSGLTETLNNPSTINNNISQTPYGDIIYSNDSENKIQNWLTTKADGRLKLKIALDSLIKKYDYILIDTQGAKGALQDAAVLAADLLITPILPEMATVKELERGTLSMIKRLYKKAGIVPPNLYGIIYKLDRTIDAKSFVEYLISHKEYNMLKTKIPQSVVFKEAAKLAVPVTAFANGNKKQREKSKKSIATIESLIKELIEIKDKK